MLPAPAVRRLNEISPPSTGLCPELTAVGERTKADVCGFVPELVLYPPLVYYPIQEQGLGGRGSQARVLWSLLARVSIGSGRSSDRWQDRSTLLSGLRFGVKGIGLFLSNLTAFLGWRPPQVWWEGTLGVGSVPFSVTVLTPSRQGHTVEVYCDSLF